MSSSSKDPSSSLPRSPSQPHSPQNTSLAAAAALNAGLQHEDSRGSASSLRSVPSRGQRRSSIKMNLALNDPSVPSPGEMQDPSPVRHSRQPSIGELHQELESEQEAQVNRLLLMIRQQQSQIQQLQSQSAVSETSPTIEDHRSPFLPHHLTDTSPSIRGRSSPHLPPPIPLGASASSHNDDAAFYQAETQNLTRENQMLKFRIRELERQLEKFDAGEPSTAQSPVLK